jgi:hypothetical protein
MKAQTSKLAAKMETLQRLMSLSNHKRSIPCGQWLWLANQPRLVPSLCQVIEGGAGIILMKTRNYTSRPLVAVCAFVALLFVSSAAAQNVGIGISNPQSKLTVNGSTASGGIAVGDSTYNIVAPVNGAIIEGDVGIGRTAPITALDVNGTASISSGAFPNSVNRLVIGRDVLQPGLGVAEFVNYFGTGGGDSFRFYFLSTGAPTTANLIASIDRAAIMQFQIDG